jgi:hypothetical protein
MNPCPAENCFSCDQGRACPERAADSNPTTRRHPRTLADAFPDVRAQAIEQHEVLPLWKRFSLFLRRWSA